MTIRKVLLTTPIATFLLTLLMFCMPQPSEQQPFKPKATSIEELLKQVKALQQEPELKHALIGAYVMDIDSGMPLLEYNSQWALSTGSTMKVITTATALAVLGSDFTFKTELGYTGTIDAEGVLKGDIYIKGGGDPTLGIASLDGLMARWAQAIKRAGIKQVDGNIIGDASLFDPYLLPRTWIWEDIGNYYGAGACALNIHENYYTLFCETGKPGSSVKLIETAPKMPDIDFTNHFTAGKPGSGDNGYIFGAPFTYQRVLRGTLPPNRRRFAIKGALPDPALQAAQWLKKSLSIQGVGTNKVTAMGVYEAKGNQGAFQILDTVLSSPLSSIVAKTNTKSINTYAEAIVKMIGYKQKKDGSTTAGTEAIADFWKKTGVDMEGFIMEDGSGLSRFNAITAAQMGQIMQKASGMPWFKEFYASLAVAGKTGTLRNMCKGQAAQGRVFAKSGSINRVRCYTGYANTYEGKRVSFTIFINSYTGKYRALTPHFEKLFNSLTQLTWD